MLFWTFCFFFIYKGKWKNIRLTWYQNFRSSLCTEFLVGQVGMLGGTIEKCIFLLQQWHFIQLLWLSTLTNCVSHFSNQATYGERCRWSWESCTFGEIKTWTTRQRCNTISCSFQLSCSSYQMLSFLTPSIIQNLANRQKAGCEKGSGVDRSRLATTV